MKNLSTMPLLLITVLGLAACGGGGGGGSSSGNPARPVPGTNGLDYGFPGQEISDAEGEEITQRAAGFEGTTAGITDSAITLGNGFTSNSTNMGSGTVQIFGEAVPVTDGVGTLTANGQTVNVVFDPSRSGTYAGAVEVVSYGSAQPGTLSPQNGETHIVFGFETNPSTISGFDAVTGNVTYQGGFQASGLVRDTGDAVVGSTSGTEMEGTIEITANYANDTASGTLDGSYNAGAGDVNVDLNLASATINSNGFAGDLTCTGACGGTSEIDATFYGPNADELGGVLALDVTQDSNGEQYDGVGTFIITRQ